MNYCWQKDVPISAESEVLVVGGGPGGVCAATMAARQGVRTLLAERYGCVGGMAVFGEVSPFMGNHTHGETMDRPLFVDWCRKMWEYRSPEIQRKYPWNEKVAAGIIAKDEAMLAMEDLLLDAGVKILYHHFLVDVVMESGKIAAAIFATKSGLVAVKAKIFIDSTGDGDLAARAGCPFEFGNADGFAQPMSTCFKLFGVDRSRIPDKAEINHLYDAAKAAGEIDCPRENVLFFTHLEDDVIHFNTTRVIRKSAVNAQELTEAEIESRRQIREIVKFMRKYVPGFENAGIRSIAHQVGVRESRRICGIVTQTAEDFRRAAKYSDGIARVNYMIDIHNPSGTGTTIFRMPPDDWYELRYGTLIPQKCDNILMGCRAISVDHALHSSMRVMPPVCSIGQAAGMAAAHCVKANCQPAELDGAALRQALKKAGAAL